MCCDNCQHQNSNSLVEPPIPTAYYIIVVISVICNFDVDLQRYCQLYAISSVGGNANHNTDLCCCGLGCTHILHVLDRLC